LDIYSRYATGWMLAHCESSDLASRLIRETVENQGVCEDQLTIHSDHGPSMASHNMAQLLAALGVTKSHSRPHVSNDNPFSESQFKTMKYRPEFPDRFYFRFIRI
jgi:putative transposase